MTENSPKIKIYSVFLIIYHHFFVFLHQKLTICMRDMNFYLTEETKRANEMSVGVSCTEQERLPLDSLRTKVTPSVCESDRKVSSRGSFYFQMGRKVSMSEINETIARF